MSSTTAPPSRAASLPLVGGDPALDFCNTTSGRETALRIEHLDTADHVLAWARHARVIGEAEAEALAGRALADPAFGRDLLGRALQLRDAIHVAGAAIAARREAPFDTLGTLARIHASCVSRATLIARDGNFGWCWAPQEAPVEAVLGPIAVSALQLLSHGDLSRLKQCCGAACGWLFLDTSKNKSRRWCEMEVCGNRAKQKRHQDRRGRGADPDALS